MTFLVLFYTFMYILVNLVLKHYVTYGLIINLKLPKNKKFTSGEKVTPIYQLIYEDWFLHHTYVITKHEIGYHFKDTMMDSLLFALIPLVNLRLSFYGYGETDRYEFKSDNKYGVLETIGDRSLEQFFTSVDIDRENKKSHAQKMEERAENRLDDLNRTFKENHG